MQGMPTYVSSIAPLALLLPINCRVENILLQAFPLTTPVWEPGTVDICVEGIWQLKPAEAWLWQEPFQDQHLDSWLTSWLICCLRQDANLDKCTKHKGRAGQRLGHLFWFKNSEANPKHIGRKAETSKLNWKVLPPDVCLADYCLGWVSACLCSCNLTYTKRWIWSSNTKPFLVHSEQLGSIYEGICVKTVVMFAKPISILLVWEKMVVLCVLFSLFMSLGETLYWFSKIKGEKGAV